MLHDMLQEDVVQPANHLEKIMDWNQIRIKTTELRASGARIVFTNGCFDLLHLGHLRYLIDARKLGDFLVLGLNSDRSVREIKGDRRPITSQDQRAEVIAGLMAVDAVVIFDDPTPYELIKAVQPDVLVKGGDWPVDQIVGKDIVEQRGGAVLNIPLTPGLSTTNIIERIVSLYGPPYIN